MDSKKKFIGVPIPGRGSNVNNGPQNNTGGKGGDCHGGGNAGQGGPGNGNNNITYPSKDSKKQPTESNKWDASGGDGLGTNVNFHTQTNVGGNGGTAYNGGNAGLGGPGNGNNNITYG